MADKIQTPLHYFLGAASGKFSGRTSAQASAQSSESQSDDADLGVLVRESASHGFLTLRGDADNEVFCAGIRDVLGTELPLKPCTFSIRGDSAIYWLGPGEWLARIAYGTEESSEADLRQVLRGHFSIVDVSGGMTLFNLSGKGADVVLQKSCTYDFHLRNFPAGRCVQTSFAKASALVIRTGDGSFDVVIRRSFADYLAKWLLDAGEEFGCRIERFQPADAC